MNIIKKNLIKRCHLFNQNLLKKIAKVPNILKFLYYGSLYSLTIIYCLTLKIRK